MKETLMPVVINTDMSLMVWLSVYLEYMRQGVVVPQELIHHDMKRVTTCFMSGKPYIIVRYDDDTMVKLTAEMITEAPNTAEFDPPMRLV